MGKRSMLVLVAAIGLGLAGAAPVQAGVPNFPGNNNGHQKDDHNKGGFNLPGFGDKGNKGDKNDHNKGGIDFPGYGDKGGKGDKGDKGNKGPGNLFGDKGRDHRGVCYEDPCQRRHVDHCGWGVGSKCHDHTGDPTAVPLPAAAWSGLSTMLGGIGVAGFRKLRRKTA